MATKETVRGQIIEALPNLQYRVQLPGDSPPIIAYMAGKMKLNKIRIIVGDTVDVVLDPAGGKATNRITRRI